MRVIDTIPHPDFSITIHFYNEKFLLKIEAGPYEQVYKFTREMASSPEEVKALITPEFLLQARITFDGMHENLKQSMGL